MKDNKGFISVSIVYSFFLVFIAIIIGMVALYTNRRILNNKLRDEVRESLNSVDVSLAEHILSNYGGASAILSMTPSNYSSYRQVERTFYVDNNYYYFGTSYSFDSSTGKFRLQGVTRANVSQCKSAPSRCRYTFFSTAPNYSGTELKQITGWNSVSSLTAYVWESRNNLSKPVSSAEVGLYKQADDLGDSYYFRGNVTNNYVQFGTYESGAVINGVRYTTTTPIYWRIVRINGDSTIRLVYDGTSKNTNGINHNANIADNYYNNYNNERYVGYTNNGSSTSGILKSVVDSWYSTALNGRYSSYIADAIFCNDKIESGYIYYDRYNLVSTREYGGYYREKTYNPYTRIFEQKKPSLQCNRNEDRYTISSIFGNHYLTYPVGVLTADEVMLAGGNFMEYNGYYLYSGNSFWTMSPYSYHSSNGAYAWAVDQYGKLVKNRTNTSNGIRPVINLRADVKFTGTGTLNDPYVIG